MEKKSAPAKRFSARFFDVPDQHYSLIGEFSRCHLVLEHFIVEQIVQLNPLLKNFSSVKLRFIDRLEIALSIDDPRNQIKKYGSELRIINSIRNDLVHDLTIRELPKDKIGKLRKSLDSHRQDFSEPIFSCSDDELIRYLTGYIAGRCEGTWDHHDLQKT